jgi:branched-chain amino acid transport system ATP-binding protein
MRPSVLDLLAVCGGWGVTQVVEDVTFSVRAGETLAILGRNGVGKTTLLELIVGRALRHAGNIRVAGQDIAGLPIHRRALLGLGYVPQEREVFPSLTVREHLAVAKRPGPWDVARIYELFPSLAKRQQSTGKQLSGGEQQMLAIARALIGNPSVLIMDEPSEGLAPLVVEHLARAMEVIIADESLAILLVEQRTDLALQLSSRCLIMDRGRLVHEGPSASLRDNAVLLAQLVGLE